MIHRPVRSMIASVMITAGASLCVLSHDATAQERPQAVLELISGHDALAMKIRPLHDRVLAAESKEGSASFKPEGVPLRAKAETAGVQPSEKRIPARLSHRDRSATSGDDYGRIKVRFWALEKKAKAERERVNQPSFGAGLQNEEVETAGQSLASLERELTAIGKELASLERRTASP